jgi:Flp pilus assembly pilin Flp
MSLWEDFCNMENEMKKKVEEINKDERGLAAIEYVIMAALMIAAVIAAMNIFAPQLQAAFGNVGQQLVDGAQPPAN